MQLDLRIRGGLVVDGTGGPPRRAEVGIAGGKIVSVGDAVGSAAMSIDAEGAIVTPGFVDVHSHYDGQATWDPELLPSAAHGVTTVVMGNCGVGFAPVRASDRQRLIELMEGVEDIPGSVLHEGIKWTWEDFDGYLRALDFPKTMDVLAQATHDPLRVYVMGDRAVANEAATDDDIARMRALLREALDAGAVGFTTGRTDNHRAKDGAATPGSEASARELIGIAGAFHGLGRGVLQAVSDFDMAAGPAQFDREFDVLERMTRAAGGVPLSISVLARVDQEADQWRRIIARAERAVASGVPMRLQVAPRAIGVILGLDVTFHPFIGFPSYREVAHLPLPERVRHLKRPEVRARLLKETSGRVSGDGSNIPPLVDLLLAQIGFASFRFFKMGESPRYEPSFAESIGAGAQRSGEHPLAAVYDALLEDDGKALLYFPIFNYARGDLDDVGEMLRHPLAIASLSDGGAHVGTTCDASFPTFLLMHWGRDRVRGRLPLERTIEMLTREPARYLGLTDRGTIEVGAKADLNVIDLDRLALCKPRVAFDLPAGGRRLLQDARGFRATIVSGTPRSLDDRPTGAMPGRLVRMGASPA